MSPTPMETLIHNVDLDRSMSSNVDDDELWDATTPWDTQIEVPAQLIEDVDDNVKAHFPEGTEIKSIHPHGSSYWSRTAEIQTVVSGEPVSYFLKVSQNKFARKMFRGEYESQKAIYEVCPDFCPRPITWGVYQTVSDAYFFLSEFIDMVDELPDLHQYPQKVAQMHKKGLAPDGRYGFHVQDMCALLPMYVTKSDSWEDFFSKYRDGAGGRANDDLQMIWVSGDVLDTEPEHPCWMGRDDFRTSMIDIMTELDRRFPETYEEWATARGEPVCPRKGSSVH
ncbi:hypothetical protein D6D24_06342 [Aureobasidium pullulans]|uniref:protein-ribulosamine 3-kinase n=1 Tax=Aureobasidium pullulans TaxID=5580 RepID=A0A4S8VLJ6_AURPU|nr:hypothetical protein D6D24_06342 [Aureobasidium pullulans]